MKTEHAEILSRFPKQRPALPPAQRAIYEQEYLSNRNGQSFVSALAQKLEGWMHQQVSDHITGGRILEIGAGTLNQVPYFQNTKIDCYDAVEPASFLYIDSPFKNRIRHFFADIEECQPSYDAIFSIAALEHIANLPEVLAKMGTLLGENGVCINAIPSEGGLLWGLSWRISTGLAYKLRTGLSYKPLMQHEHVNNHDEIVALHHYFFDHIQLVYFPLPNKHLSFYCCIKASGPKLDVCQQYLNKKAGAASIPVA